MILYSDTEPRGPGGPVKVDPTKAYLRHYGNMLYLRFLADKSPDPRERGQALREMTICQRKMDYHYRSADRAALLQGIQVEKRKWNSGKR